MIIEDGNHCEKVNTFCKKIDYSRLAHYFNDLSEVMKSISEEIMRIDNILNEDKQNIEDLNDSVENNVYVKEQNITEEEKDTLMKIIEDEFEGKNKKEIENLLIEKTENGKINFKESLFIQNYFDNRDDSCSEYNE